MPLVKKTLAGPEPQGDDGLQAITARLHSAGAQQRWEAARHLAGFAKAVPALAGLLEDEPDEAVREAAFSSLAKINSSESFDAVLRHLRAEDAALRTAALDALKLMPAAAGRKLETLLHDPDADVRVLACDLARAAPPSIARQSLGAILVSETEVNVCAAAIDLLAEIGTSEILPALRLCAKRFSSPFLDFSIRMADIQIIARSAQPPA